MGGAAMALSDMESALYNIAALPAQQQTALTIAFNQPYTASEFATSHIGLALPLKTGTTAASITHYGNATYHEEQLTCSYALPLNKHLFTGISLVYLHAGTDDGYYEPQNLLSFSLALFYQPSEALSIGFRAYNPAAVRLSSSSVIHTPALFNLGIGYQLSDELLAVAEVEKNLYHNASLRMGVEYSFRQIFAARIGFVTEPLSYTFGLGVLHNGLSVNLAGAVHPVLGLTPLLSAHYRF